MLKRAYSSCSKAIYHAAKRLFDLATASILLVIAAPLMAAITVAIVVLTGTPILSRQSHLGRNGVTFVRLRFRTLRYGRGPELSRLTPLGARLRAWGLDQLPQLWNVLRGDMSLIGPRPFTPESLPLCDYLQLTRFDVRPGFSGLAQVHRCDDRSIHHELALDVEYVASRSLLLDLSIMRRLLALHLLRSTDSTWPCDRPVSGAGRGGRQPQRGQRSNAG